MTESQNSSHQVEAGKGHKKQTSLKGKTDGIVGSRKRRKAEGPPHL